MEGRGQRAKLLDSFGIFFRVLQWFGETASDFCLLPFYNLLLPSSFLLLPFYVYFLESFRIIF
jgi:hypothetical protein